MGNTPAPPSFSEPPAPNNQPLTPSRPSDSHKHPIFKPQQSTEPQPKPNSAAPVFVCQKVVDFQHDFLARFRLTHPNLLRTLGFDPSIDYSGPGPFQRGENLYFEYEKNSIQGLLAARKPNKLLSDGDLRAFIRDMVSVLAFLQERDISHGDLDTSTIFFKEREESFKIYDQELLAGSNSGFCLTKQGVKCSLLAPEIFQAFKTQPNLHYLEGKYFKSDVFSLGMVFLEVGTLMESRDVYDFTNLRMNPHMMRERLEFMRQVYSREVVEIVAAMIEIEEQKRPDFIELRKWWMNGEVGPKNREIVWVPVYQNQGSQTYINPEIQEGVKANSEIAQFQQNTQIQNQFHQVQPQYQQNTPQNTQITAQFQAIPPNYQQNQPQYQKQSPPIQQNSTQNAHYQQNIPQNQQLQPPYQQVQPQNTQQYQQPQAQNHPQYQQIQNIPQHQQNQPQNYPQFQQPNSPQFQPFQPQTAQAQQNSSPNPQFQQIQSPNPQFQQIQSPNPQFQQIQPQNTQFQQIQPQNTQFQQPQSPNSKLKPLPNSPQKNVMMPSQNYMSFGELKRMDFGGMRENSEYIQGNYGENFRQVNYKPENLREFPELPQIKYVESYSSENNAMIRQNFATVKQEEPVKKVNYANLKENKGYISFQSEEKDPKESLDRLRLEIMNSKKIIENYEKAKRSGENPSRKQPFGENSALANSEKAENFQFFIEKAEAKEVVNNNTLNNLKIAHKTLIERNRKLDERLEEVLRKSQAITKSLKN